MRFCYTEDYTAMSKKAASIIAAQVVLKQDSVLGLATGSTPIGTYDELVRLYESGDVDFSHIHTVNLDEYVGLNADHDQSYHFFMHQHLFGRVNIKKEQTNLPDGSAKDPVAECARYDQVIRDLGGVDLQLLGLGHNGHIGFNEPAAEFPKGTHLVALTESTIQANSRLFEKKEDVPRQALTMGIQTIMSAKKILVVVSGKDKAAIVKEAFFGPVTPNVPASILQLHPDVTIVGDADAFSLIDVK